MNKNLLISVVLGVLVVIAVFQAVQLVGLKNQLGGAVNVGSATASVAGQSGGGAELPSNLQNLPSMVGGC